MGSTPGGREESDTTEQLNTHTTEKLKMQSWDAHPFPQADPQPG